MSRLLILILAMASSMMAQAPAQENAPDYSGMYSFLQEGEFLQLTVEDHGIVTGFISRFKEGEDQKTFVDHFFKLGRLEGNKLSFTTEVAQNISYDFKGTIERGEGKKPDQEAYYILKGTLTQSKIEAEKKSTIKSQTVALRSFPQDIDTPPPK